ncbi:hypothetical protein QE152_g16911 [Popillia japonica]|uniref:Uncharacterized protein n=1 Tax=Popillia japonica TaxID=7064 RepID=A0AAW1L6D7_POPJA
MSDISSFYALIRQPASKYEASEHASVYDPSTLCNPEYNHPIYKTQMDCKKSRHGVPLVQPVIGCCKSGKCGDPQVLKNTKYALVRICEFIGFNTYEIMKPYKDKPKNIPTCIAEIFVTLQKEDNYYIPPISQKSTRISFQVPDTSTRSITKVHSVPYSPTLPGDTPINEHPQKTKSKCCAKRKTNRSVSIQQ